MGVRLPPASSSPGAVALFYHHSDTEKLAHPQYGSVKNICRLG
ncbi:MAG: hypothetical protein ACYTXL_13540 [Nostoc sp.]